MQNKQIAALILAAGTASRMGRAKQILPIKTSTIIEEVIKNIKGSSVNEIYCVLGSRASKIEPYVKKHGVLTVYNNNFMEGLSSSIKCGIQKIQEDGFEAALIVLADQPMIEAEYFNTLIENFNIDKSKVIATKYNNGIGVPVLISKSYFSDLLNLSGDKGAKTFLKSTKNVIGLEYENLSDIDTKSDYEALLKGLKTETMLIYKEQPQLSSAKLTAIWAVSESGLGGVLHAAKIPFSGIFLGSIAIIIISYLAQISNSKFSTIIKATLIVIAIKAMVSPHSPPMAYVAVLFQGALGAFIYGSMGFNRISAILLGGIALLESAFQKILTLTIIFGIDLWESIQQFFNGIEQKFQTEWIKELPWLFLVLYGVLYLLVGIFAGNFAFKLPVKVSKIAQQIEITTLNATEEIIPKKTKRKTRLWLIIGLLLFSCSVFIFFDMNGMAISIILRTLAAVVFFLFLFNPIFKFLLNKWITNKSNQEKQSIKKIMDLMPEIKSNLGLALTLSADKKNVLIRTKLFIMYWLALSIYYSENDRN